METNYWNLAIALILWPLPSKVPIFNIKSLISEANMISDDFILTFYFVEKSFGITSQIGFLCYFNATFNAALLYYLNVNRVFLGAHINVWKTCVV